LPLSKKYYQMIADVLKGVREDIEADSDQDIQINKVKLNLVGEIARRLGDQFNADNPRFDFSRFEKWVFNQFPHIKERS
jgi:hypothetical protein